MFNVDLVLNNECSYNCNYCKLKDNKSFNNISDEVLKIIQILNKTKTLGDISLQGGDISHISVQQIKDLIQQLPKKPILSVQPSFFEKNYHKEFMDCRMFLHVFKPDDLRYSNIKNVYPGFADTVDNILKFQNSVKKYNSKNLSTTVIPSEAKKIMYYAFENDFTDISEDNLKKEWLRLGINIDTSFRKDCYHSNRITINLVNNSFIKCIRNPEQSFEVNLENFQKLLKKNLFNFSGCESCSKSFIDRENINITESLKILFKIKERFER